ncbi:MAG TPA: hypothetical protein VJC08_01455, partial [bacterium]|nr:hypothetical protein [bacterium]
PDLIHEVLSAKELESKEKNASALKKPPRRSEARAEPKNKEELLREIYAPLPEEDRQRLSKLHGEYIQYLDSEHRFEDGFWSFYDAGAFLSTFHHKGMKHVLKAFHPNFWRRDDIQNNIKNGLTIGKGIFSPYISIADAEIRKRILLPALDLETDKGWVIQEIAYPLDEYLSLLKRKWEAAEGVETKKDIEKTMRLIIKEWARLQYRSWAQRMILKDFGLENSGLTPEGEVLQIDNEFNLSRNDFFIGGMNSAEVVNSANLGMLKGIFGEENAVFVESFYGEGVEAEYFDILWPESGAVAVKKEAPLFGVEGNPQSQKAAQKQFLEDFIRSVEVESSRSEARETEQNAKDAFDKAMKEQGGLDFSPRNLTDAEEMMNEIKKSAQGTVNLKGIRELLMRRGLERRNERDVILGLVIKRVLAEISGAETKESFVEKIFSSQGRERLRGLVYDVLKNNSIRKNIPSDITLADSMMDIIGVVTAKGLVLGEAMAEQGVSGETLNLPALTPAAKALLQDHAALQEAYSQFTKTRFKFSDVVLLGTVFLKDLGMESLQNLFEKSISEGRSFKLVYDNEMRNEVKLAQSLAKRFPEGVTVIPNGHSRPLTTARIRSEVRFGLLPRTTAVDKRLLRGGLVFGKEELVRELAGLLGGMAPAIDAVELMKQERILNEDKEGWLILGPSAIAAFISRINQIAETQRLVQQAA